MFEHVWSEGVSGVQFTSWQIDLAQQLKTAGLPWIPAVGQYVYDTFGVVQAPSPFQDRVYFILNYDYFVGRLGGLERFTQYLTWLPTWEQARVALRSFGISDAELGAELTRRDALAHGIELQVLYELMRDRLPGRTTAADTTRLDSASEPRKR